MRDPHAPERLRLFVAMRIPEEIKAGFSAAQAELREDLPDAKISWAKTDQLHLTLKFLGNVETQRVDALRLSLVSACQGFAPLRLRADGMGAFPNLRDPRVLWIGLNDPERKLHAMQKAIETACSPFTAEKPQERFSGHVTLARVKRLARSELPVLSGLIKRMEKKSFGEWMSGEIQLMQSQLGAEGARHTCIEEIKLG